MNSSQVFCAACGAANPPEAQACFACGQPPQAPGPAPAPAGPLALNRTLKGRYRLLAQIGKGGFGAVYQAEDTALGNRQVAVKEMQSSGLAPQELTEATEAFHREALLLAGLSHPSLPRIYDHFSEGGRWYLVMDFIEGETLEAALSKVPGGRLPLARVLAIGLQLCKVLEYLHTRQPPIIFRDLKPSNVMLTPDGSLALIDFGIARFFKPGQAKDTMAFGSPGYAAPEQYGKAQTTPRSDVYSLGALLHHLLSGHDPSETPFRFASLPGPDLDGLNRLIGQMVSLDAATRPQGMAAARQSLEMLAAAASIQRVSSQGLRSAQPQPAAPAPAPARSSRLISAHIAGGGLRARDVLPTYRGHAGRVNALAWSPDGRRIASGSADKTVQVWDVAASKTLWTSRAPLKWMLAVIWSPDGARIVVGGASLLSWWHNPVLALDAQTGKKLFSYRGHFKWVLALAWSPDGTRIASAGGGMLSRWDDAVNVWDATSRRTITIYKQHTNKISAVAWSPDGARIASGSADTTVQVWQTDTGQPLFTYRGHRRGVRSLAWSPDGRRIASAGDRTVQVWQADTPLVIYQGHAGRVYSVAWSPDGQHLASGGADGTVQVWEADTGQPLFAYRGHAGPVSVVAWSPDGRWIASGGADATVQVWDAR